MASLPDGAAGVTTIYRARARSRGKHWTGCHRIRAQLLYQPIVVPTLIAAANVASCTSAGAEDDFAGLVDIGRGRSLYLDCQGSGSSTVFIIPGTGSYAEVWDVVVRSGDPIRSSPYDVIGQAKLPLPCRLSCRLTLVRVGQDRCEFAL